MKSFTYIITDPLGIHARPAGMFAKKAASFPAAIKIGANGKEADAKKIFGIMGLAAKAGTEVTIFVDGENEESVAAELETFFKENL